MRRVRLSVKSGPATAVIARLRGRKNKTPPRAGFARRSRRRSLVAVFVPGELAAAIRVGDGAGGVVELLLGFGALAVDTRGQLAVQVEFATAEIAVQLRVQLFLHLGVQIDRRHGSLIGGDGHAGRRDESEQGSSPDKAATHILHESVFCKMAGSSSCTSVKTRGVPQNGRH